jgi:aminoglycoside 2''-phosphotransferase
MSDLESFAATIRQPMPDLAIEHIELNQEGLVNDIAIINDDLIVRFPKTEQGIQIQLQEIDLLNTIRPHLKLRIPDPQLHDRAMVGYPRIQGSPLTRELLASLPSHHQEALLTQLAEFLSDLHAIPTTTRPSEANRPITDWQEMLSSLESTLFPLLFNHQRQYILELFAPVISGRLDMNVEPVIIHGDLAPYHILLSLTEPILRNSVVERHSPQQYGSPTGI